MKNYRNDFPIFDKSRFDGKNDYIYFDNAATTQRPSCVLDAVTQFYQNANANPLRGLYDWSLNATAKYEEARHAVAEFIHAAQDEEIIFTRNTTESLNLVAQSYGQSHLHEGDEVVLSVMEHHSNILPWQVAAKKAGAHLVWLEPDEEGVISKEEYESKITDRCKILAIAQVSNVFGVTNPVKEMIACAHSKGAVVVVDGAQSTPHIPVDVQDLNADFFAFSGHKLMAPMGIGVLYGRFELLDKMPPFLTGGEMIEYVTRDSFTTAELPAKFEAGTVNAGDAVGLHAAIRYLQEVGFKDVMEQEEKLTKRLMDGLKQMDYIHVYGSKDPSKHSGIVTFTMEGVHPHDISSVLNEDHVCIRAGHHCAQPLMQFLKVGSTARASLYFYNTEEEVDRFLEVISGVRKVMGYGA